MESTHSKPNLGCYYGGILGISFGQLFCGIGNLALGIANAVVCGFLGSVGYGIWGSVFCFVGGVTGIVASQKRSRSMIVTHMVFSIIIAVSACVQLAMGAGSATADHQTTRVLDNNWSLYRGNHDDHMFSSSFNQMFKWGCSDKQRHTYATTANGPTVTDALLASFAIFQGILAIISACLSCRATVCPPGVDTMPWEEYGSEAQLTQKA